jgi:hypothetical protein
MSPSLDVCHEPHAEHGAALPRGADEPLMTAAFVTYYFRQIGALPPVMRSPGLLGPVAHLLADMWANQLSDHTGSRD